MGGSRDAPARSDWRLALAVVLAAALHGLVWLAAPRAVAIPRTDRIQVELREIAAPPAPAPLEPAPPARSPRPLVRRETRPLPAIRPEPTVQRPASAPPAVTHEEPPSMPGEVGPPSAPAPEGSGVNLFDRGAIAHSLGLGTGGRGGAGNGTDAEGSGENGDGPKAEERRVTARIGRDLAETQARDRVAAGLVDPYFQGLRRAMRSEWQPSVKDAGGADGDGAVAGIENLLDGWKSVGGQWARTGSPFPEGTPRTGEQHLGPVARSAAGTSGFDGADFMSRWNRGEFAFPGGLVILQLVQASDGRILTLDVLTSSGLAALDEAARQAITRAASDRPPPPHGLGLGGPTIRSLWKLEARRVPKTASLLQDVTGETSGSGVLWRGLAMGGTFDETTGSAEADVPLTTSVVATVTLLAVYGGEGQPR